MSGESSRGKLKRVLSTRDVFVLAFGAMIGWGWIVQVGYFLEEGGVYGATIAFVLGGALVGVVGLVYGELASAMPFAGGEHVYTLRALGPLWSFVATWALVLGYVGVVVFEVVALPSAFAYLIPNFNAIPLWTIAGETVYATWALVGGVGAITMTYLNYRGIRPAAQFQAIFTVIIALAGVTLVIGAVANGSSASGPLLDSGVSGIYAVALMVPFFFVGFDVIPQAAGEADISRRKIGMLIPISVVFAALFYIAIIWGAGQSLPASRLVESPLPAALAMENLFDSIWIGRLMALAGIAGILTSWNSFLVGGSRAIYALADSSMIPSFLGEIHDEYNTPKNAILLIGVLSVFSPLFGKQMLTWIVNTTGLGLVVAWFLVTVSFFVLRYREPEMDRPFRLSFGLPIAAVALVLNLFFIRLYLPGGASSLVWPYEWGFVLFWIALGGILSLASGETEVHDVEGFEELKN